MFEILKTYCVAVDVYYNVFKRFFYTEISMDVL